MKRGKLLGKWVVVWTSILLVGSLIAYVENRVTPSNSTESRVQTSKLAQTQTVNIVQDIKADGGKDNTPINLEEQLKSSIKDQATQDELSMVFGKTISTGNRLELKDFPCPVYGNPYRKVGNYYSESLGCYLFHGGIDYSLPEGTVIRATQGGKVIFSGRDLLLGQKVTLDCGEGWLVTYGGLDNLRVKVGETIESQEALGQVGFFSGAEGDFNQPQLHYELWDRSGVVSIHESNDR